MEDSRQKVLAKPALGQTASVPEFLDYAPVEPSWYWEYLVVMRQEGLGSRSTKHLANVPAAVVSRPSVRLLLVLRVPSPRSHAMISSWPLIWIHLRRGPKILKCLRFQSQDAFHPAVRTYLSSLGKEDC